MKSGELKGRAAVVVIDGMGLDPQVEWGICTDLFGRLDGRTRKKIEKEAGSEELAAAALGPTSHGVAKRESDWTGGDWLESFNKTRSAKKAVWKLLDEVGKAEETTRLRMEIARERRYAPWAANTAFLYSLRQDQPTWITRTAGVYTGFDDMDPEVMGNSDTGHQQIFNLTVARQVPTFISHLVSSGEFFNRQELNGDMERAGSGGW